MGIFLDENLCTSVRCLPLCLLQKVRDAPQEYYAVVLHTAQNAYRFPVLQIVFRCCRCSILSLSKRRLSCQSNLLVLLLCLFVLLSLFFRLLSRYLSAHTTNNCSGIELLLLPQHRSLT